ncbi:permease [Piscinibacter sp. Jin2]|uniref:Permease n=1 Tax=Aquariibacter lacus TaxID=2801332 RepID=A0A9X0XC91_9BURK|nr:permease [Piscinibacter lacus]MBL0718791.1 permease [Piscinibacter lacus]
MIARLLRLALALLLLAMLALVFGGLAWGRPLAGMAAALALPLGLALIGLGAYAIEMLLAAAVHRDDPWPRPRPAERLRALWGELCIAAPTFLWHQAFRAAAWPDRPGTAGQRGLVLVHGHVCNRGFWNRWLARLAAEGRPVVAVTLEPPLAGVEAGVPCLEAAVARLEAATGRPPLLVAHSMGGLVWRAWRVAAPGNDARLAQVMTIGTPHHGTWLARLGLSRNARDMRPGSDWLRALAAAEARLPEPPGVRCCCVLGSADNVVFPPSSAVLAGAETLHLPATAHIALVEAPAVLARLQQGLA